MLKSRGSKTSGSTWKFKANIKVKSPTNPWKCSSNLPKTGKLPSSLLPTAQSNFPWYSVYLFIIIIIIFIWSFPCWKTSPHSGTKNPYPTSSVFLSRYPLVQNQPSPTGFSSKLPPTLIAPGSTKMSLPAPLLQPPPWKGGHVHCYVSHEVHLEVVPYFQMKIPALFRCLAIPLGPRGVYTNPLSYDFII